MSFPDRCRHFALLFVLISFAAGDSEKFRIKQFIVLEDVLLPQEKNAFKMESEINARFYLLDSDSKLTDLGRSYPIELASTGSCLAEMEVLNRCLSNRMGRSNEKVSITIQKTSRARNYDVKRKEILEEGQKLLIDEDCTNNQIDLEECIVTNDRYYPCIPPERDLKKYRNLYVERVKEFSKVLKSNGYQLVPVLLQFEAGNLSSFEVRNFDEKYKEISKKFLETVPKEKLPEPFEIFKRLFIALKETVPKNSLRFIKFEKSLKNAACKKESPDNTELFEKFDKKIEIMKKKLNESESVLDEFQKAIAPFYGQIPKQVPDTCNDNYLKQVDDKIKVMEVLGWDCKQD